MPGALTQPSTMPHVHIGVLASPVRHHAQLLNRMESLPMGGACPRFDPCSAPLDRQVEQTPHRVISCRCRRTAPLTASQRSITISIACVRRVNLKEPLSDADAARKGIQECIAQAVVLTIRRK
jgi:hypothetical protein